MDLNLGDFPRGVGMSRPEGTTTQPARTEAPGQVVIWFKMSLPSAEGEGPGMLSPALRTVGRKGSVIPGQESVRRSTLLRAGKCLFSTVVFLYK